MENKQYIFKFECGEELQFSGQSNKYKGVNKVKLVSEDNGKEIKFHGCYFGAYNIFKPYGEDTVKFQLFVHRIRDNSAEEAYLSDPINLKEVKAKVILDNQCEYRIALSLNNNEWIILPSSSLHGANNDNLRGYYGKNLDLLYLDRNIYIKHNEQKVCRLIQASLPVCLKDKSNTSKTDIFTPQNDIRERSEFDPSNHRLVIEKDEDNKLSIYLSDQQGNVVQALNYLKYSLELALLKNSNIKEVLPELEIDDNVNLDTRQLKCWVNKESTIKKIANELITEKKEKLGQTVLDATDSSGQNLATQIAGNSRLQNAVADNPGLGTSVATNLQGNENFKKDVAAQLLTGDKKDKLVTEVASNKGLQGAVATHLKGDEIFKSAVKGDPGQDGESPDPSSVAAQLMNDANRNMLVTKIAGNSDLRDVVKDSLKNDGSFQNSIAEELINKKANELSQAILDVKKDGEPALVTDLANNSKFQASVASNGNLQAGVTAKLREDPGNAKGTDGVSPDVGEIATKLITEKKEEFGQMVLDATDSSGKNLATQVAGNSMLQNAVADNSYLRDVVKDSLKNDGSFQNSIAEELIARKASELSQAILDVKKDGEPALVTDLANNSKFQASVASNGNLQAGVTAKLREDPGNAKGTDGVSPDVGEIATKLITEKKEEFGQMVLDATDSSGKNLATQVAGNSMLQNAVADNSYLRDVVKDSLKNDGSFQNSIAEELIAKKASELSQAILDVKKGNEPALAMDLANNKNLQKSVAGNLKNDGGVDISQIVDSLKPKFTLQKGENLSEGIYEANVVLDDQTIATLPKIGYYMLNDQLVMHNYATQEKVVIPEEFHYLKVVRLGSGFGNDDYKLTFCNTRGNEFFEYKKYDPEYSRVSDEYKFISLSHAKKEYNPNLSELLSHRPLFLIAEGPAEPGSDKYAAAVFELTRDGKGKKMATLIDEFSYFNQNGEFMHCNYHEKAKCRSYTSAEIDEKYQVTDADSEFYLTEYDNIAIHAIPEL